MDFAIRTMTADDWSAVLEIYQQGIESNLATFERECPTYEEWDTSHLETCRLVATVDNVVVGWVALSPVSSRCVYNGVAEVSVYIDKDFYNNGIATALLEKVIPLSEQNGIWTLQSGIMQDNVASIKLHEKCGFRMIGYREKIGRDHNGKWRNTVQLERRSPTEGLQGGSCQCLKK